MHLIMITYVRVVEGSACSKLSNTDSHLLGSIPADKIYTIKRVQNLGDREVDSKDI